MKKINVNCIKLFVLLILVILFGVYLTGDYWREPTSNTIWIACGMFLTFIWTINWIIKKLFKG